jgi:hypothetical protein
MGKSRLKSRCSRLRDPDDSIAMVLARNLEKKTRARAGRLSKTVSWPSLHVSLVEQGPEELEGDGIWPNRGSKYPQWTRWSSQL